MTDQKTPKVQVILSTYNGEKFLNDLLDSVLAQDYPNINILIRDDGSNDSTTGILRAYESLPNVEVLYSENIGAVKSYFELLKRAAEDADYIAFCDQDDVWLKDKVSRAVFQLEEKVPFHVPGMYFSRCLIVNEKLEALGYTQVPKRVPSFENALVQNITFGCTMVINKQAWMQIIKELPLEARMHDWWVYQVVSALGIVVYDSRHSILYRQHSSNVVGIKATPFGKWMRRLIRFVKQGHLPLVTRQARELLRIYEDQLPSDKKEILRDFLFSRGSVLNRIKYALRCRVYRQTLAENFVLRVLLVLNRI